MKWPFGGASTEPSLGELIKRFEDWDPRARICICEACRRYNAQRGVVGDDTVGIVVLQLRYIVGEDWEADMAKLRAQHPSGVISMYLGSATDLADGLLADYKEVRQVAVYHLRLYSMVMAASYDAKGKLMEWMECPTSRRIISILQKYGGEFPDSWAAEPYEAMLGNLESVLSVR